MTDPLLPVQLTPAAGIVTTESPRSLEGRWVAMDKMRFFSGHPQKIGGWNAVTAVAMAGSPRTLHAWRDNDAIEYIGAGTYKKLYVVDRSFAIHDITPIASSGTLGNNPFATTSGSAVVTVTHTANGQRVGNTVHFSGATAGSGITISGEYEITGIVTANTYTILHTAAANATSAGVGGAAVAYQYEIEIGVLFGAYGLGYGTGGYGRSTYGTARTAGTFFVEPRIWSIDHFGRFMLDTYNTGALYSWDPSAANPFDTRAAIVVDAPTDIRAMFITPERFIILLRDDMTIQWSDQGDYTVYTPAIDNVAGIRSVTEGTKLVAGRVLGGGVSVFWTDSALYLHQYTGDINIFNTRLAGKNCGLISPSAAVSVGGAVYWMGQNTFFLYNGSVREIPHVDDIRSSVFDDLDPTAAYLCAAMYVAKFNEVWFFWSPQNAVDPSAYAIVSLVDWSWATGTLTRVAGTYFGHGDTRPYFAGSDGLIYLHEDGVDDNGAAMDAYVTLAPAGLEKGKRLLDLEGIEPDFFEQSGDVTLTLDAYDRIRSLDDTPQETQENTVTPTDTLVDLRLSGRYAGLTVRSNTLGGYFRFGAPTVYVKESGSRR